VVAKQGSVLSLNFLPYEFLVIVQRIILKTMYVSCHGFENIDEQDVETRVSDNLDIIINDNHKI